MANIASLSVSISARLQKFKKGMKTAGQTVRDFAGKVGGIAKTIGKGAVGVVGGVVGLGTAIAALGLGSAKAGAAQVLFARRLGASQAELAEIELAGTKTGETIDGVRMATQRFARRTQEAAAGTGELKQTLEDMNIDAKAFVKLPLPERMRVYARELFGEGGKRTIFDAIPTATSAGRLSGRVQELGNETNITMRAFKAFDAEGVFMVNVLRTLIDEEKTLKQETKDLGLALTEEQENALISARKAWQEMFLPIRGLITMLGVEFTPTIDRVAGKIKEWSQGLINAAGGPEQLAKSIVKTLVVGFAVLIDWIGRSINKIGDFVEFFLRGIGKLITGMATVIDWFIEMGQKFPGVAGMLGIEIPKGTPQFAAGAQQFVDTMISGFEDLRPSLEEGVGRGIKETIEDALGLTETPEMKNVLEAFNNDEVVGQQKETNKKLAEIFEFSKTNTRTGKTTDLSAVFG